MLQTDNHASISALNFFTGWLLFLTPNQQRQSAEGTLRKDTGTHATTVTRDIITYTATATSHANNIHASVCYLFCHLKLFT